MSVKVAPGVYCTYLFIDIPDGLEEFFIDDPEQLEMKDVQPDNPHILVPLVGLIWVTYNRDQL